MAISGKTGFVKLGTSRYAFNRWSCPIKSNQVKTTNFESLGFQEVVSCITSAGITCSGPYAPGSMSVVAGQTYTFHLGWTNGLELVVQGNVASVEPDNDAEGVPQLKITVG